MPVDEKESILNSTKKLLGIFSSVNAFDTELILHINSVLSALVQMGIGPSEGYAITNAENSWSEFLGNDKRLESVKTYVFMRVRLLFDPPSNSSVIQAYENQIKEFEWRNYIVKDTDRINLEKGGNN